MFTPKVTPLRTPGGFAASNQFIIEVEDGATVFQSYRTIIAMRRGGEVVLDEFYWDYSRTTMKYLGQFLGESAKEIRKKVAAGEYRLANLNG